MEDRINIEINKTVLTRVPKLFVRIKILKNVIVSTRTNSALEQQKQKIIDRWRNSKECDLDSSPLIIAYRELNKRLGGDPNRNLPAVEGMITRGILKGNFPAINSAVDSANIISINNLIPIGLFDFDKIVGNIELTLSENREEFTPIGSKDKPIKLPDRTPVLKDNAGIFSAVGIRDSERTKISTSTINILAFSWGTENIDSLLISSVLDQLAENIF